MSFSMNRLRWGTLVVAAGVLAIALWQHEALLAQWQLAWNGGRGHSFQANGVVLFASIALLPLVGVPVSPLWVASGALLGVPAGLGIALLGLFCNLALAYWLAHYGLRSFIEGCLHRRGWKLPAVRSATSFKLTLLVRVTPGLPLFAQNYLLGIAGIPFPVYIWVSMAVQSAYAAAFVVFGEAALSGRVGILITALLLLVALALLFSNVLSRLKSNSTGTHDPR